MCLRSNGVSDCNAMGHSSRPTATSLSQLLTPKQIISKGYF